MFAIKSSLDAEMRMFSSIMKDCPERGQFLLRSGQDLVANATAGNYRKFCENAFKAVAEEGFPINYFFSKSFSAAFLNHHLLIAVFLLDNGYPVNNTSCPNVLIECIKANMGDEECCEAVDFLGKKSFDFNRQEDQTWFAPLHYAVQARLPQTVDLLIKFEADVNAVADKDVMPLTLARNLPYSEAKTQIIEILERNGAKESWKKSSMVSYSSAMLASTNISTKPATSDEHSEKPKFVKFSSAVLVAQSEDDGGFLFSTG